MKKLILLLAVLTLVFTLVACGGDSDDDATEGRIDDDDDDNVPPVDDDDDDDTGDDDTIDDDTGDDDTTDDDTGDDDTIDDDTGDDDTGDDDTGDDGTIDDDTGDDDTGDDDTGDDDTGDDDTTGEPPTIDIVTPAAGQTYTTNELDVLINITNADIVEVYLDGNDVTGLLLIGDTTVTGTLDGLTDGAHALYATAENSYGFDEDTNNFTVEIGEPYLDLQLTSLYPQVGTQVTRSVHVYDAQGNDITGSVTIDHNVNPTTGFTQNGDVFTFDQPGTWTFTASCEYNGKKIELSDEEVVVASDNIPHHITLNLSATTAQAGAWVNANVAVFNQFNEVLDHQVAFNVEPGAGVTINYDTKRIQFTIAADYTVTAFPAGYPAVTATDTITITAGAPVSLDLDVSANGIDAGETIDYEVEMVDTYGNHHTSGWTIASNPSNGVIINTTEQTITFNKGGEFVVTASYSALADSQTVNVTDNSPPTIAWTSPARGTFTENPSVVLAGVITDIGGDIAYLKINDLNVSFGTNGVFSYPRSLAQGYNLFVAEVADNSGNTATYQISVLRGSYLANDAWVENAVGARVNQSGLDRVEEIAIGYLEEFDITQYLPDPLVDETFSLGGQTCDVFAQITSFDYSVAINLEAMNGYIWAEAILSDVALSLSVSIDCADGTDETYVGSISFDELRADIPVYVDVVDNELSVTLGTINLSEPTGFSLTVTGFDPSLIEQLSAALEIVMIPIAENLINQIVQEEVPPLIEEALADLELAFSFELLEHTLSLEARFNDIEIGTPGIILWMDGKTGADAYDPNTPAHNGSYYTIGNLPDFGAVSPGYLPYELAAGISDDMLNEALYVMYRSGLLTLTLDDASGFGLGLTAGDLELFFPGISDIYGEEAPVVIHTAPKLPPIIDLYPGDKAAGVELEMGEFFADIVVQSPTDEETTVLAMVIYLDASVTVDADATGSSLTIEIGTPELALDITESMSLLPTAFFEEFMPMLVQFVLPLISSFLEEFPIPAFEGYSMQVVDLTTIGTTNDYLGIYGNLVEVPADAPLMTRPLR
ncbi:MAG TPA: hypothetical protein PKW95_17480 [bacterium]|nr:hypothetical protein [bacterium]